ncbi:MAG: transporter [Bacteroidetes bacterium]|nr:MAG: transporter [Bacteroidota bacterium]
MKYQLRYIQLLIAGIALISLSAKGQENSMSLDQCIQYAMKNSIPVKNADLDYQSSKYKVKETTAIGFPQINGKVDFIYNLNIQKQFMPANIFDPSAPEDLVIPISFGLDYANNASITATQLIFDGSYIIGLKAAKTFTEFYRNIHSKSKTDVAVNVSKAYYFVLITKDRLSQLIKNEKMLQQLFNDTKVLQNNGFVESIDLKRIEINVNNLNAEIQKLRSFELIALNMLKFQMGMPIKESLELSDKLVAALAGISKNEDDPVYSDRPEFKILNTQIQLNELNLQNEKIRILPSLGAFYTMGANYAANSFSDAMSFSDYQDYSMLGFSLNVPIFSSGQRKFRISQAKISVEKSQNDLSMLKSNIDLESIQSRNKLNNSLDILAVRKENMQLAEEVYNNTKLKYEQGVGSNFEVLSAQTDLKTAQTDYYAALYDVIIAKIDLDNDNGNFKIE